jgi:hypothetical protein
MIEGREGREPDLRYGPGQGPLLALRLLPLCEEDVRKATHE